MSTIVHTLLFHIVHRFGNIILIILIRWLSYLLQKGKKENWQFVILCCFFLLALYVAKQNKQRSQVKRIFVFAVVTSS